VLEMLSPCAWEGGTTPVLFAGSGARRVGPGQRETNGFLDLFDVRGRTLSGFPGAAELSGGRSGRKPSSRRFNPVSSTPTASTPPARPAIYCVPFFFNFQSHETSFQPPGYLLKIHQSSSTPMGFVTSTNQSPNNLSALFPRAPTALVPSRPPNQAANTLLRPSFFPVDPDHPAAPLAPPPPRRLRRPPVFPPKPASDNRLSQIAPN